VAQALQVLQPLPDGKLGKVCRNRQALLLDREGGACPRELETAGRLQEPIDIGEGGFREPGGFIPAHGVAGVGSQSAAAVGLEHLTGEHLKRQGGLHGFGQPRFGPILSRPASGNAGKSPRRPSGVLEVPRRRESGGGIAVKPRLKGFHAGSRGAGIAMQIPKKVPKTRDLVAPVGTT
jgi:hypothetical protein